MIRLTVQQAADPIFTSGIVALGNEFIEEAKHPSGLVPKRFFPVWVKAIREGVGEFYVALDGEKMIGVLGAFFAPELFSGELQAQEAFWFVTESARNTRAGLLLLNEFEKDAVSRNCKSILMVHLDLPNAPALSKLYGRRGYIACEKFYRKRI